MIAASVSNRPHAQGFLHPGYLQRGCEQFSLAPHSEYTAVTSQCTRNTSSANARNGCACTKTYTNQGASGNSPGPYIKIMRVNKHVTVVLRHPRHFMGDSLARHTIALARILSALPTFSGVPFVQFGGTNWPSTSKIARVCWLLNLWNFLKPCQLLD